MPESFVRFDQKGAAGILTFNAPERLNSLNTAALHDFEAALKELEGNLPEGMRALVLTGEGKAFIAGADIKEMEKMSPGEAAAFSRRGQGVMNRLASFPLPVIAAVNGFALGGGLETALACDFIYVSEKARLGLPETTLGIFPGFSGNRRLKERIGAARAKELIFTGRIIRPEDALVLGLVNKVCAPEALMDEVLAVVEEITRTSPNSVTRVKEYLNYSGGAEETLLDRLEQDRFGLLFGHPDQREGMGAFLTKNQPKWRNEK
jgi:enoyl-CoA hydratase